MELTRTHFRARGFSLIEVILSIVIIAGCFLGLVVVMSNTTLGNIRIDASTTSTYLARGKMAEMMAKDFSALSSVASTNFGSGFSSYSYTVTVTYVDSADLDTTVVGPTSYKRVDVSVKCSGISGEVHLYDLKVDV
jgi:prepilin-type N-terminal cleavage/methylation domain-containing protein